MYYVFSYPGHNAPEMMKAVAARIAVGLAAHVRLARSPDVNACRSR